MASLPRVTALSSIARRWKFEMRLGVRHGQFLNSWGQFTLKLTPRSGDGEPVTMDGRFSDLAVLVDGRRQYLMDHASIPTR